MLDPAPRSYAKGVRLFRRLSGPVVGQDLSLDVEAWLLDRALQEDDLIALFRALIERLLALGLPLDRVSLHVGTLHPQLIGFAWVWNSEDDLTDEMQVPGSLLATASYRDNPIAQVLERRIVYRARLEGEEAGDAAPLMRDLKAQGYSDYIALPVGSGSYSNALTLASRRSGGFAEEELRLLKRILQLFALHVERHLLLRVTQNVLDTYLGPAASSEVLTGSIQRGSGRAIRAVIWVSDLRGFTALSDRLSGPEVTAILNLYFECLVEAIAAAGGEVLKFVGDGLLAVFPFADERDPDGVAAAALSAAQSALAALERLNAEPPEVLAGIEGWHPLRNGIALHEGEVFFGNVGGPQRLDFTVIGRAVNEASRVEALSKDLGRSLLITAPVAERLQTRLEPLGAHALSGLAERLALFGLPEGQGALPPTGPPTGT